MSVTSLSRCAGGCPCPAAAPGTGLQECGGDPGQLIGLWKDTDLPAVVDACFPSPPLPGRIHRWYPEPDARVPSATPGPHSTQAPARGSACSRTARSRPSICNHRTTAAPVQPPVGWSTPAFPGPGRVHRAPPHRPRPVRLRPACVEHFVGSRVRRRGVWDRFVGSLSCAVAPGSAGRRAFDHESVAGGELA